MGLITREIAQKNRIASQKILKVTARLWHRKKQHKKGGGGQHLPPQQRRAHIGFTPDSKE